jgi:hypothetical protein
MTLGHRGRARPCNPQLRRLMLSPVERRGHTPELRSFVSIVMAKLKPLRSKIAVIAIAASMSLLVGLIAAELPGSSIP